MIVQDTLPSQFVTSSISWTATITDNNTPGDSNIVSGATGSNTNDLVVQLALGPQDTITILATGTIDPGTTTGTVISNEVEVPGIEDTSTGNDSPIDETTVANATDADLDLLKSISNTSPNVGDTLTYTLTLSNTGPANATGVEVSEQLPAGLTFVSSTPSQGTYNNGSGIWDVGTVNNSANATLEIVATVNAGATSLSNTAQVSASDQTDPDSTPGNNIDNEDDQATVTTPVGSTNNPPDTQDKLSETIPNDEPAPVPTLTATDPDGDEIVSFTITTLPPSEQGTLLLDGNPVSQNQVLTPEQASRLVFNPNPTFTGNATFNYTATDSQGNTDTTPAMVTLPVEAPVTNSPPEAQNKTGETRPNDEPSPVPTLTATDPDDDVSFYTVTTLPPPSQGTLLYNGVPVQAGQKFTPEQAGQLVFDPNPSFSGDATFEYTATDEAGNTDQTPAIVTLPLVAPTTTNPPEAQNKTADPRPNDEPSPVPTLTGTDPDNDISFFTVTTIPPASQGTLFYNGEPVQAGQTFTPEQAGQLVFDPNPNFTGDVTFNYTVTDETGNTDPTPATVTLPLTAPTTTNPPEAQDKNGPVRPNNEPSPVPTLTATDPDNDVSFFTVTSVPTPEQGTLFYNGEPVQPGDTFTPEQAGHLVFDPNPNFTGDATFNYTVTDETGNTDPTPAMVTLPLTAPTTTNPPEAIDRSGPVRPNDEPSPVPTLIGTDPDGDISFFTVTTLPSPEEGTLFYNGEPVQPGQTFTPEQAGQLIFDPTSGFTGDATFEYTVTDTQGNTDPTPATVTLPIQAATDGLPPIATSNPNNPVPNNTPSPVTSLLGNDPDGELSFLRVNTTIPPEQGTLLYRGEPVQPGDTFTPEQAAQLVFDPNPNYTGDAEFTFTAIDDDGNESSPATVTIPIIGATPTTPPVANPATSEPITQGSSEPASVPTLTGSDPDGIVSFFTIQDPPTPEQGTLFLNGEPVVAGQLLTPGQASQLTFVPNPNFTGNATFTFIATDETGNVSGVPGVVTLPVVGQTPVVTPQPNTGAPMVPAISPSDQTPTVSQVNETPSTLSFLGFDWSAILGIGSHLDCLDPNPEFYAPSEARVNFNIVERDFFGSEQAELLQGDHDNNQIFGNGGYDLILAYQSNDTVFAGNGNDTAYGGRYHDILLGQEGTDLLLGDQDNDTVFGGPGDDIQFGGQQNDWLLGGFGNDTAIGDRDNDWVFGEEGFDSLMGHFNQDIVFGGINSDTIHGGRGWDILFGGQHPDTVFGDLGNDTVHGNLGNDSLMGGMHRDWIYGHRQRDVIHAGQGDDVVFGGQEEDTVFGDRHDDTLSGDDGNDSLMGNLCYDIMFGDRGNDTMHGGQQTDLMFGGQHQDSMFGDRGQDVVSGDRGSDTLYGNLGGDFIFGGTENDTIYAGQQDDWIWGGQHQDSMYGDRGRDVVSGDRGNDTLYGNLGRDFMFGGTGQDTIFAGQQDDWAYGGQDSDFVSGDRGNDIVSGDRGSDYLLGNQDNDTLYGETEADWIHGGQQNDVLYGGQQNDTLNGDRNNDVLFGDRDNDSLLGNQNRDILSGGAGNDILFGGQEEDTLDGNQGDDTLSGDLGQDFLYGGDGIDVFVLRTGSAANNISLADIVADFQVGLDFIGLTGGLTFVDVTLEVLNNTTIVTITQTNQVLGIINGVTPEELIPAIIPVDIGLV
ncbi:MAG: tandem-95 repeat protein [Roseofilum sp. Belize Diploria]|nr:tandem-95 repeat protein [Roseofilum sp. Belize Diploria]